MSAPQAQENLPKSSPPIVTPQIDAHPFGQLEQMMSSPTEEMQTEKLEVVQPTPVQAGPVFVDLLGIREQSLPEDPNSRIVPHTSPLPIHDPAEEDQELIVEIQRRITRCKVVAKKFKDINDKQNALTCLRTMKTLERVLKEIQSGEKKYALSALPEVPAFQESTITPKPQKVTKATMEVEETQAPSVNTISTTTSTTASSSEEQTRRARTLDMLEAALRKQIDTYVERAKVCTI